MHTLDASDGELAAAVSDERSEDAFRELLRRHGPLIQGVCRRLLPGAQDVDDAVQVTLITLSLKSGELRGRASISGWLHHVARHSALHVRRERARGQRRSKPIDDVEQVASRGSGAQADLKEIIDLELESLPEIYRVPIILCYLDGHPPGEAARMCGRKPSAFSMQLARGLERLRDRLRRHGITEMPAVALPLLLAQSLGPPPLAPPGTLASTLAQVPSQHVGAVKACLASLRALELAFIAKCAAALLAMAATMTACVIATLRATATPVIAMRPPTAPARAAPTSHPGDPSPSQPETVPGELSNEMLMVLLPIIHGFHDRGLTDLETLCVGHPSLATGWLSTRDGDPDHRRTALHFLVKGETYSQVQMDDGPAHVPAFGTPGIGVPARIDDVIAAIDVLLKHGAPIDAADPANPWTPLIEARDRRLAEHLLARGARDSIFYRARSGDVEEVRALLSRRPELARAAGPEGATPLHFAAWGGNADVCQALIASGADPDAKDLQGRSPLVWLFRGYYGRLPRPEVSPAQIELARLLVAAGARWDLDSAIFAGATDAATALVGDHPDLIDFKSAVALDRPRVVALMLERGVDVDASQALVDAVMTRNAAMVRLLLEHGADPDLKTNFGTPRASVDRFPSPEVSAEFAARPAR